MAFFLITLKNITRFAIRTYNRPFENSVLFAVFNFSRKLVNDFAFIYGFRGHVRQIKVSVPHTDLLSGLKVNTN
jgi:hypothetical protein